MSSLRLLSLASTVAVLCACSSDPAAADPAARDGEVLVSGWPAGTTGEVRMWINSVPNRLTAGPFPIDAAGRFRYVLGTPADLLELTGPPGVTVTPAGARYQSVIVMPTRLAGEDSTATGELRLGSTFWGVPLAPGVHMAGLFYVDRDVSLTGTADDGCTFDQHLEVGWNFAVRRWDAAPPHACRHTASRTLPADLGWHYRYLGP